MIGVIDAGTTNIKLFVYDEGKLLEVVKEPIVKHYPKPGWVEIDAEWLAKKSLEFADYAIDKYDVEAIAITNQRATTVLWDAKTGKPLFPALGWQDVRAEKLAEQLNRNFKLQIGKTIGKLFAKLSEVFPAVKSSRKAKWLIAVSRFSLSPSHMSVKLRWMLDALGDKAEKYELKAGTIDSWLIYNLTGNHVTDYSNAAATGIYDSFYMRWSRTVMEIVEIGEDLLPETKESDKIFGEYRNVPVTGVIADQSASLYALGCWNEGDVKITNGTGSFVDVNVGEEAKVSTKLIPLIAWKLKGETRYMLEGIVLYSGSAVELMKELGLYDDVQKTSSMAFSSINDDILLVPAFTGLGTPHDVQMKGVLYGLSNTMKREDVVKALLEAIAFRIAEILEIIDAEFDFESVKCDGAMSANDFLLQRIADTTGKVVERAAVLFGSSFGAHLIAGRAIGKWKKFSILTSDVFTRKEDLTWKYGRWKRLVEFSKKLKL